MSKRDKNEVPKMTLVFVAALKCKCQSPAEDVTMYKTMKGQAPRDDRLIAILNRHLFVGSTIGSVETALLTLEAECVTATAVALEEVRAEPGGHHQEEDHAQNKGALEELVVGGHVVDGLREGQPRRVANAASASPLAVAVDDRALKVMPSAKQTNKQRA